MRILSLLFIFTAFGLIYLVDFYSEQADRIADTHDDMTGAELFLAGTEIVLVYYASVCLIVAWWLSCT